MWRKSPRKPIRGDSTFGQSDIDFLIRINDMKKTFPLIMLSLFFSALGFTQSAEEDDAVIFVTATKIGKPVAEQRLTITEEEIEKSNAENLTGLLQRKGMQILSYGAYGLEAKPSIRGFTDETVRVVIDGICVNNAQYGTFDFSSISLNQIEKIEIVRGGFTEGVSDEGSVGGTVYITLKKKSEQRELSSDTSLKTYFNQNFQVDSLKQSINFSAPIIDERTFFSANANLGLAKNLYLFKNYAGKISERTGSSVWDSTAGISISHFFENGMNLSMNESVYAGNKFCPGPENSSGTKIQKDYDSRFTLNFSMPDAFSLFSWENNFSYIANIRFYDATSEHSAHYVNTLTFASYLSFFGNDYFKQDAGFSFDGVFLDSTDDGKHNQFTFTLKSNSKIYMPNDWALTVPLAVKFQGNNFAFVPKIGINKKFSFGEFSLNAYRMIQFPNMDDMYWNSSYAHGNPDLIPEDGWGGEFSFNSFIDFIPVSACVFSNYYRNKIQWSSASGRWRPENVASAFYFGIDFDFDKKFFDGLLGIKFNCEYLYTMLLDDSNAQTYGKRIMWTPDFVAALIVDLNLKSWTFTVDANYTGKRYVSNLNISFLDPYVLLNASASYTGFSNATPYMKLENILCQDYESVENYPMPLISLTLGCSLKFKW